MRSFSGVKGKERIFLIAVLMLSDVITLLYLYCYIGENREQQGEKLLQHGLYGIQSTAAGTHTRTHVQKPCRRHNEECRGSTRYCLMAMKLRM